MPHTASAFKRLRTNLKKKYRNRIAKRDLNKSRKDLDRSIIDPGSTETETVQKFRRFQKVVCQAANKGTIHKNQASRMVSRYCLKIKRKFNQDQHQEKMSGYRKRIPGAVMMEHMKAIQKFMRETATPADQLSAFTNALSRVRATFPDQWVVYQESDDIQSEYYPLVVLGHFESQSEAISSISDLPDTVAKNVTITFCHGPKNPLQHTLRIFV